MTRAVVLSLVLAACGTPDVGPGASARDSAGVRIVESRVPVGGTWAVSTEPLLSIGSVGDDPDRQLFRVTGAVRLPDGRIAVANAGFYEIRLFDAEGHFLRRMGSRGSGPGEFQRLAGLFAHGDSLVALDTRLGRLSVFDLAGRFQRSAALALPDGRPPTGVEPLDADRMIARAANAYGPDATPGIRRDSAAIWVVDYGGAVVDSVGRFPAGERLVVRRSNTMTVTGAAFGRATSVAAHGGLVYVGDNARWEVGVYAPDGRLRRLVRLLRAPVPVTRDDIEAYRARALDGQPEAAIGQVRELLDAQEFPATFPAYADITVDDDGGLWVRAYTTERRAPRHWDVFGADGRWLSEVTTPEGFSPYAIGGDYLLGRWIDPDGVEFVRIYGLSRTS